MGNIVGKFSRYLCFCVLYIYKKRKWEFYVDAKGMSEMRRRSRGRRRRRRRRRRRQGEREKD